MSPGRLKLSLILTTILILAGGFFIFPKKTLAAAGINKQINFQGKVVNSDGTNVSNNPYTFVFKLYTQQDPGGTAIWTDTETLTVTDGIFQYNLGSDIANAPLPGSVDFNTDNIYLGVEFNGNGEMSPRIRFTAAPYAFNADNANNLGGETWEAPGAIGSTTPNTAVFTTATIGAAATYDPITISPVAKGAGAFTGTISSLDLTGAHAWNFPNLDGTVALTSNKLSDFAATTSLELLGNISDETGTGKLTFATSPTFLTGITLGDSAAATFVLTSALSGATDPTLTFGNDLITASGDLKITGDDLYMNTNTTGYVLVANGTSFKPVATSGDVTITSTGATAIGANKVTGAMIALTSDAAGDIMYYNGTDYVRLAAANGGVLTSSATAPSWVASTSGTYLLQNANGTITWVAPPTTHTQNTDTGTTGVSFNIGSGTDQTNNDVFLSFGSGGAETFNFDGNGTDNFLLSDDLDITGGLTTTTDIATLTQLKIRENVDAAFYGIFDVDNLTVADKTYLFPNLSGTVALTTNNLSIFAATTSAQLSGVLSDENTSLGFMTDPMTTIGDIIYGDTSGVPARLGGSAGFLTSTGAAAPIWTATSTDYFTQYALLAGRSGGQILTGGTAANNTLTIQGNNTTGNTPTNANLIFKVGESAGTTAMTILNSGNVGIGTTTPGTNLEVAGSILASGFVQSPRSIVAPAKIIGKGTGTLTSITTAIASGSSPQDVAVDPTGRFVYVTNGGTDTVSMYSINQSTGALTSITTAIASESDPVGVAVDPTGRFVYVANWDASTVSMYSINQSTGALTSISAAIASGSGPVGVVVDPTGRFVYVTNFSAGTVSMYSINQSTGALTSITTAIAAGTWPEDVSADPTGRFVYVTNSGADTVSMYSINQSTGALTSITTAIAAGTNPWGVATDPTGRFVYVANNSFGGTVSMYSINQSTGALTSITTAIAAGTYALGVAVDPTGRFVYVVNNDDATVSMYSINNFSAGSGSFGRVGIGTTAPAGLLDVSTSFTAANSAIGKYLSISASTFTNSSIAGTYATEPFNSIGQPTLAATNAVTTTDTYTLNIAGAPIKSTNQTITNTTALNIVAGAVGAAANSYGLTVNAQTGATANYAAAFLGGNVGIGVTNPAAFLHITASTTDKAQLRLAVGADPSVPAEGDFWYNGTNLYFKPSGAQKDLLAAGVGDMTLAGIQTVSGAKTFNTSTLKQFNPAGTFAYTIVPSAIAAARNLTLPLLGADDTIATLGMTQTFTGVNTMSGANAITHANTGLLVQNPAGTFTIQITPSAEVASRVLTIPLLGGADTLMTLGTAQTVTGVKTFTTPNIGAATGTSLAATGVLSSGTNGGTGGQLTLSGATSGSGIIKVNTAAGSGIVFQLPSSNGANTNVLSTDGAGVTSWVTAPGGSQTPWTSDISAAGFDLNSLSNILFQETTVAPIATDVAFYRDNTGDLSANVLTGKTFNLAVNGTDEYNFSSSGLAFNSNNITGLGTNLTAAAGLTIATTTTGALTLDSGTTGAINIGTGTSGKAIHIGDNDTTADTLTIGSAKDSLTLRGTTIAIGNAADTTVSIADNNWSVNASGAASFASVTSSGAIAANGGITFDNNTDTVGAHTMGGNIIGGSYIITDIGNTGTDFIASTGALTLAGVLTANGGVSMGTQTLSGTTGIINYTGFDVDASGNLDALGTLTAGSSNVQVTDAAGKVQHDSIVDCADGQILKWATAGGWGCAADETGSGGGPTTKYLVNQHNISSATATEVTQLQTTLVAGTYVFKYSLIVQSSATGTGVGFGLNYTGTHTRLVAVEYYVGTGTAASTGVIDETNTAAAAEQIVEGSATRAESTASPNMNVITSFSAANQPAYITIEGVIVTSGAGDFELWRNSEGAVATSLMAGSSVVMTQITAGADLAEIYGTMDESIMPGDVVSLDSSLRAGVKKSTKAYDKNTFGIISTSPGIVTGSIRDPEAMPVMVALSGRVPVKVTTENGPIKFGDLLTSSSIPGVAMRATKAGQVIGQAMSEWSGEGVGKVMAFIKTDYSNGAKLVDIILPPGLDEDGTEMVPSPDNKIILAQFMAQKEQLSVAVDLSEIITDRVMAGLEVITPTLIADRVETNAITSSTGNDIQVLLDEDGAFTIGGPIVTNEDSATASLPAVTIDNQGNALFLGTLTADAIVANKIVGLEIYTDKISGIDESVVALTDKLNTLQTAEETIDLSILGILEKKGGLVIAKETTFKETTVFEKLVTLLDNVIFRGTVSFEKVPTFNQDTAGYAIIKENADNVAITFEKEYIAPPVINASLSLQKIEDKEARKASEELLLVSNVNFIITNVTAKGFEIRINQLAITDIPFSWQALAVKDAKTFKSEDIAIDINQTPAEIIPANIPESSMSSGTVPNAPISAINELVPPAETPASEQPNTTANTPAPDATANTVTVVPSESVVN